MPSASNKRKRDQKPHILLQQTLRKPQWSYLHLRLVSSSSTTAAPSAVPSLPASPATSTNPPHAPWAQDAVPGADIDALTARALLLAPLAQFLGHMGAAVAVDVLRVSGRDVWVRVPRGDGALVVGAVSGWVGRGEGKEERVAWRVVGRAEWLGGLTGGGDGEGLFG